MLGEVTIAFTFAEANVCVTDKTDRTGVKLKGKTGSVDNFAAGSGKSTGDLDTEFVTAQATRESYTLSDLKMSMVRYNLPMSYSEALASNLSGGAKYQIAFDHYEFHSQEAYDSGGNIRWNENSRDIKGLLAFFTDKNRANAIIPKDYDAKVDSSPYFKYDNPIHQTSQFQIGSVKMPQNALKSTDAFLELTRAIPGARGNNVEFYNKVTSVGSWLQSYFMAYLSLEMTEGMTDVANGGKKLLSGLSSEQLPISCSYEYTNDGNFKGSSVWAKNVNVMSLTTRVLVIENGQSCHVEI